MIPRLMLKLIRQRLKLHWKVVFLKQWSSSTKKKVQTTSSKDSLLDLITNPPLYFKTPPEVNDPDKAFLLLFLPDIKKLNDQQKMK